MDSAAAGRALTPEKIKTAYLASLPNRRRAFNSAVRRRHTEAAHETMYMLHYPQQILAMAEDEIRARHALAAQGVRNFLDSGWPLPSDSSVRKMFVDVLSDQESLSDLEALVRDAFVVDIGRNDPPQMQANLTQFDAVRRESEDEFISALDCHVRAPAAGNVTNVFNNGNVETQQIGDGNTANNGGR
jgi:hypothetical protein